jgi:hypothetical protein
MRNAFMALSVGLRPPAGAMQASASPLPGVGGWPLMDRELPLPNFAEALEAPQGRGEGPVSA